MAQIFGGRWKVLKSLPEGGQAWVHKVVDGSGQLPGEFALKALKNPKRQERFDREIRAVLRVKHEAIITLIDHAAMDSMAVKPERSYLVMPLAAGGNLEERVPAFKGVLDACLVVARQLAEALATAHESDVIHRDVKPQNILFPDASNKIWLSDFGICLLREESRLTPDGEAMGPRAFMAPELEGGGNLEVQPAADVYSLGKVIYYMLSGGIVLPRERFNDADVHATIVWRNPTSYGRIATIVGRCSIDCQTL